MREPMGLRRSCGRLRGPVIGCFCFIRQVSTSSRHFWVVCALASLLFRHTLRGEANLVPVSALTPGSKRLFATVNQWPHWQIAHSLATGRQTRKTVRIFLAFPSSRWTGERNRLPSHRSCQRLILKHRLFC